MKKSLGYMLLFFLGACASNQKVEFTRPSEKYVPEVTIGYPESENIDYEGLQSYLRLNKPVEKLGYSEKSFPTCEVGYGYSSNRNCRRDYFVLIHFQLFCRDSNEDTYTEALSSTDMKPLNGRSVNWTLSKKNGQLKLDSDGYGQIKTTARSSMKAQRLKINIDNENLYLKAGEMNKIVTPSNWCN